MTFKTFCNVDDTYSRVLGRAKELKYLKPLCHSAHIYDWLNPFWMLHVYLASVIAKKIARVKSDIFIMINFCFENATRGPAQEAGKER